MGKHLVCSDLHGQYDLWAQIKEDLQSDDTLFFLGDAIDRGPHGWKLLKELLTDRRVTFICGNHEDMMLQYFATSDNSKEEKLLHWMQNGGSETLQELAEDDFGNVTSTLMTIDSLPLVLTYTNPDNKIFILSHAGMTPQELKNGALTSDATEYSLLWDREHYLDAWHNNPTLDNVYVIHGHTPIPLMLQEFDSISLPTGRIFQWEENFPPLIYDNGHKINIDCGAFASGLTVVYNMDDGTSKVYQQS